MWNLIQWISSVEDTVKTLVAVYKLSSDVPHYQSQDDVEPLLSQKTPGWSGKLRDLSVKQLQVLARHLYTNIVNHLIKLANTFGAPSEDQDLPPASHLLSLYILHSFPPTTQTKQSNDLQDLLVNLHKETFRVI